jgi:hypothetical protein
MSLAGSGWPEEYHILLGRNEVQCSQVGDRLAFEGALVVDSTNAESPNLFPTHGAAAIPTLTTEPVMIRNHGPETPTSPLHCGTG